MKLPTTQALQLAVLAHRNGELAKAEQFYRAIIDIPKASLTSSTDPGIIALAHNNLGFIQQHRGELDAAIKNYRRASRVKPDYHEAFNNLGYALQLNGDMKAAIESYKKAIDVNSVYVEAYHNLGYALQSTGELKASTECYQKIVEIQPGNADAHNALGAAMQLKGDLEAAVSSYAKAVELNPEYFEALNNMGSALLANGDPDAAIDCCHQAIALKTDYANAYNNLGHALSEKGETGAAIDAYESALKYGEDSPQAYNSLGNALRAGGDYAGALKYFDVLSGPKFKKDLDENLYQHEFWLNTKSQSLECLYILGRYAELEQRLQSLYDSVDINRRVAAVSAFVSHQLKLEDRHRFCTNPLDFIHVGNLQSHIAEVDGFTKRLVLEGLGENQVWEPKHGVTKSGYQTPNTIFTAGENCELLEKILREEIASYHARFKTENCGYMELWPKEFTLRGWHVRLVKSGYQNPHIHPGGWLSGIVYLKTLDLDSDEGAIEFSLHGADLPIIDASYPRVVHRPKRGEIVLFPSSLFHRTIPYNQETDRCVIAFDLLRS